MILYLIHSSEKKMMPKKVWSGSLLFVINDPWAVVASSCSLKYNTVYTLAKVCKILLKFFYI
jgi:hypothetical protein